MKFSSVNQAFNLNGRHFDIVPGISACIVLVHMNFRWGGGGGTGGWGG